jgi:hypothetical protein
VFDANQVKALATYLNPLQLAQGFDVVFVNGAGAREAAQFVPTLAGCVLAP